jgi:hypothetical protein
MSNPAPAPALIPPNAEISIARARLALRDAQVLRLRERVEIGASRRFGEIVSLYDGPYAGDPSQAKAYARLRMDDGTPDTRPVAELSPAPESNGESA